MKFFGKTLLTISSLLTIGLNTNFLLMGMEKLTIVNASEDEEDTSIEKKEKQPEQLQVTFKKTPTPVFLPNNSLPSDLDLDMIEKNVITDPTTLKKGELIINYSMSEKRYFFAIFNSINNNQIILTRHTTTGPLGVAFSLQKDGKIDKKRVYRLNKLSRWIYQPIESYSHFLPALKQFNEVSEYQLNKQNLKSMLIPHDQQLIVIGDLHGDHRSLASNLLDMKKKNLINSDGTLNEKNHLVFLGDATDRGIYGIECWYILMELAMLNPGKVHILQGNHENNNMANQYGFKLEFSRKISTQETEWTNMLDLWERLPLLVLVGCYHSESLLEFPILPFVMFSHASINPYRNYSDFLATFVDDKGSIQSYELKEKSGRDANFNWGDFASFGNPSESTYKENIVEGERGASEQKMNLGAFHNFCKEFSEYFSGHCKLSGLIRGHQHRALVSAQNIGMLTADKFFPWKKLETDQPNKLDCSVCSIISAPNVTSVGCAGNNAYATIKATIDKQTKTLDWYIIPHRPQLNAY